MLFLLLYYISDYAQKLFTEKSGEEILEVMKGVLENKCRNAKKVKS